ncbi:Rec8 like protein-domain-containing protein [Fomes fomentarius]|nr:Rec8 like protein-domain-containing protein [Fomes fomentarius]
MFFSPDLLERRDSGFGLLWLAATLGAKSSFKKLPKRSVLTADISQLCGLIAEPPEPLALRLSSNLMIGVTRVYKVKQEIFFADVTTCFHALKKAVQDLSALSANAMQLQMGQPSLRVEALTLVADPGTAFGIDFDSIFVAWSEREQEDIEEEQGSDDEFDPKAKKPKSKGKQRLQEPPLSATAEHGRARHTLEEHHNHLLAAAFSGSLTGSVQGGAGFAASSSQVDGGFGFDDNLFELPEGLGDIGDELARELGEGWGASATHGGNDQMVPSATGLGHAALDLDLNQGVGDDFRFDVQQDVEMPPSEPNAGRGSLPPTGSVIVPLAPFSPRGSNTHLDPAEVGKGFQRKAKRVRLLLDARTELTDEELKMARANYVQDQEALKREMALKKAQKENSRLIEKMIYGAPKGVEAPVLVDFWMENFKLQVGARSGELHLDMKGEPPTKRRRVRDPVTEPFGLDGGSSPRRDHENAMDVDQPMDFEMGFSDFQNIGEDLNFDSRMRSSEEPGQGRRGSRPPSAPRSYLDLGVRPTGDMMSASQRSSFFPWDHAGPSSSVGGAAFGIDGSDILSAMRPASKRGSSLGSRRESFLLPGGGGVPSSPADFGLRNSQIGGEDFLFNVPEEETHPGEESQQSNALTLEKNSFNFLEYAKMQLQAFPNADAEVSFDDVVPKATSTPRVAAAAFYHCLVLATKDLLSVRQEEAYGVLKIRVK